MLVRLEATALGQLDWSLTLLDALPRLPLVPGAEGLGRVEAVGPGVQLPVGARVALAVLAHSCGQCPACAHAPGRCAEARCFGLHDDGALGEVGLFAAQHLVPVPEALPLEAGVMLGSLTAAVAAVRAAGPAEALTVFGVGGLGHLVVQVARAAGRQVFVEEPDGPRRAFALAHGAQRRAKGQRTEAAVVCTPSPQALQQAVRATLPGGTVVLAGTAPATRVDLTLQEVVRPELSLVASFLGSRDDQARALALAPALAPQVHRVPPDEVSTRFYELRDGGFVGRLVVRW